MSTFFQLYYGKDYRLGKLRRHTTQTKPQKRLTLSGQVEQDHCNQKSQSLFFSRYKLPLMTITERFLVKGCYTDFLREKNKQNRYITYLQGNERPLFLLHLFAHCSVVFNSLVFTSSVLFTLMSINSPVFLKSWSEFLFFPLPSKKKKQRRKKKKEKIKHDKEECWD